MTVGRDNVRREMRVMRQQIPAQARIGAAEQLALQLAALPFASTASHVAGYWAMQGEIALHAWQLQLPRDVVYCLPVLHEDQRLRFAPWRPGAPLEANRYGIPEPAVGSVELLEPDRMDMVVVPLVAFDARCRRLGMGGGWYDRTFAFRLAGTRAPWLVGAAFASQQVETLATEAWDVPLDAVCTEVATFRADPGAA